MTDSLDIATVARLTGLTSRTLRFYETRGLLSPLRSHSGRRYYGAAELERIHQIITLKRAGLSLAQIERIDWRHGTDFGALIAAQIAAVTEQALRLRAMRSLLLGVKARLDRREVIDIATFCTLISKGDEAMRSDTAAWDALAARYLSEQTRREFAQALPAMTTGFDEQDYADQWKALGDRIKSSLPLAPESEAALGFVREWFALLAPFSFIATPAMWDGARSLYDNLDEWYGQSAADPGFDAEVWRFITSATEIAITNGAAIGPLPPWMQLSVSHEAREGTDGRAAKAAN